MSGQNIRDYIKTHEFLMDGAFGTYYRSLLKENLDESCEMGNLTHASLVSRIHMEYAEAGANGIKTNTFSAYASLVGGEKQQKEIVDAAVFNVMPYISEGKYLFGDLGQAPGDTEEEIGENYISLIKLLRSRGVTNFIFETMTNTTGLHPAIEYLRKDCPEAFVILSFGVYPDGYTTEGRYFKDLLREGKKELKADYVGMNCVASATHLAALSNKLSEKERKVLSVCPNAGYPVVRGFRMIFEGNPGNFANTMEGVLRSGVRVLGGCCGTTPEYTRFLREMIDRNTVDSLGEAEIEEGFASESRNAEGLPSTNRVLKSMTEGHQVIAVELDSPLGCDASKFVAGAKELKDAGVNCITIADNPIARARMDAMVLATKVKRELDLDVIPHMTCRDRNVIATRSLLLGGYSEGIRNTLLVTGDPIPSAQRDEVQKVYQFNSRKLISYVNSLNEEVFEEPMAIYGALNVNARNFDVELGRAIEKQNAGAIGFLTQPAMTDQAIQNLKIARESMPEAKILGGIIPVVSEKNGLFMQAEISGITLDAKMIESYHDLSREEGENLAERYSVELAEKILPYVDGIYLMTPFGRTGLMSRIIKKIRPMMR